MAQNGRVIVDSTSGGDDHRTLVNNAEIKGVAPLMEFAGEGALTSFND